MGAEGPQINKDPTPERFPTKEEVLRVIPGGEQGTIVRESADAEGVYQLDVEVVDVESGETITYSYSRPWRNPAAVETVKKAIGIDKIFPDGFATSWKYRDRKGNWVLDE